MELGRPGLPRFRSIWLCLLLLAFLDSLLPADRAVSAEGTPTFAIRSFAVEGNTLLPEKTILDTLEDYKGANRTSADVEKARAALEKVYHDKGYPAVLVNIPEQTVTDGKIRLQVIESRIGRVRVTGNRYFTGEMILRQLPSLAPGKILYVPMVQKDLERINRGQDLKVSPVLSPGMEPGTTDVELKVQDDLPLHGNLELNNRSTLHTTDLRLNAMLRYDNLWQMGHSLSVQYQTSPQNTEQVKLYSASYTLPAPWMADHQIALYGVRSDSNTAVFGEGLLINGKGSIFGVRYVIPLAPYGPYAHNITLGLDYKDFQDATGFTTGAAGFTTPVTYVPLSASYNSSMADSWGVTRFSGGLNVLFRGLLSNQEEFQTARYQSRGNYLYMTAGVERDLKLPADFSMFFKVDGQVADQPLIFHEEYIAGGMMSVRGYKEAAALGDDALHGTAELSAPDLAPLLHLGRRFKVTPFLFYDYVWLNQLDPLQSYIHNLQSTGAGLRGGVYKNFYYEIDLAYPLAETNAASKYQERWFFKAGVQF